MKYLVPGSLMVVGLLAFTFSGCGSGSKGTSQGANPASSSGAATGGDEDHADHDDGDHEGHDHAGHDHGDQDGGGQSSAMAQMEKGLAGLSPEDAASARKQHICPVSGEMLGAMGTPIKVEVKGQQVWLCCSGCKDKLLADPDKYLAKLKK